MHIAEGFLPPAHAIGWTLAAAPFVVHGARSVVREVRDRPESTLLLGAAGAFTFVLSAIKLPSVTGSSSHATGTGVGAVLFRPPVMALLLAHGGLTTLGANAVAFAVVGPWVGYGVYRLAGALGAGLLPAVFAAVALADLAIYLTVVLSTHDVDLALRWADEVAVVVDRGVVQGPPAAVLGDDDLLARARLDRPWPLTVGARLRALDLLPLDGPLPRDAVGLLATLPGRPEVRA